VRERCDKAWFDTSVNHQPGETVLLFNSNERIGDWFLTNMQVARQLTPEGNSLVMAIGARIPGATQEEEDRLLDYFMVRIHLNTRSFEWRHASLLSTLRTRFEDWSELRQSLLMPEIKAMAKKYKCPVIVEDAASAEVAHDWLLEQDLKPEVKIPQDIGYQLRRPLVVPARGRLHVEVRSAPSMPEPMDLRVTLFGLESRDVT
jgi:hypothetical protein